jgi:hypothetical protein
MSEDIYCRTILELHPAIAEAFSTGERLFPALLLLYSSMDVVASFTRPIGQEDTSGEVFKAWIDRYMLPASGLKCRSEDLWAARCGMLHTLTIESKLSREGRARRISDVDRSSGVDRLQQQIDRQRQI